MALVLARNPGRDEGKGGRIERGKGRVWVYTETRKEAGKGRATGLKITWPMLSSARCGTTLSMTMNQSSAGRQWRKRWRGEERARRQRTPGVEGREGGFRGFAESGGRTPGRIGWSVIHRGMSIVRRSTERFSMGKGPHPHHHSRAPSKQTRKDKGDYD